MAYRILSINPGSTSTKIALYEDKTPLFVENIVHSDEELAPFPNIVSQFAFRKEAVLKALEQHGVDPQSLAIIVGRGGMLPPIHAGAYLVNEDMKEEILHGRAKEHASNLGALIGDSIGQMYGISAYIYDAVCSDEMPEIAKLTGVPGVTRQSFCHVLNAKATARKVAEQLGKRYEDCHFVVAHIGGGISVSAHQNGRIIDNIPDDAGPFSPERGGSVPLRYIIDLCYSGKYTKDELNRMLRTQSGIKGLLGTNDCREVEQRVLNGDKEAELVYHAEAYQIAKGIGQMLPTLCTRPDAIILTGGLAYSKILCDWICEYVSPFGKVVIMPGENELEALALGGLRILEGKEEVHIYHLGKNEKI